MNDLRLILAMVKATVVSIVVIVVWAGSIVACATMMNRLPDSRVVLNGSVVQFSGGADILGRSPDAYRCLHRTTMYCEQYGSAQYCSCVRMR